MGKSIISMDIFNSCVSLPEGKSHGKSPFIVDAPIKDGDLSLKFRFFDPIEPPLNSQWTPPRHGTAQAPVRGGAAQDAAGLHLGKWSGKNGGNQP